jgi:chromosome segregation ATPase
MTERIDELGERLAKLEKRVARLSERVTKLEQESDERAYNELGEKLRKDELSKKLESADDFCASVLLERDDLRKERAALKRAEAHARAERDKALDERDEAADLWARSLVRDESGVLTKLEELRKERDALKRVETHNILERENAKAERDKVCAERDELERKLKQTTQELDGLKQSVDQRQLTGIDGKPGGAWIPPLRSEMQQVIEQVDYVVRKLNEIQGPGAIATATTEPRGE